MCGFSGEEGGGVAAFPTFVARAVEGREWVAALAKHPRLRLDEMRLINPEVIRGMELNTPRYEAMVRQALPKFLHKLALDFAGVQGSRLHRDAVSGEMSYRSFRLTKKA